MNLAEHVEKCVDKLRAVETQLPEEQKLELYKARRYLQTGLFEHEKQGERIPVRKTFVMQCEICKTPIDGEEAMYLHLRKKHKVSEEEAALGANVQRDAYQKDLGELRRLLAEYTDADLEDDFTRGFTIEETYIPSDELRSRVATELESSGGSGTNPT
jgi:hypothetical protein